MDCLRAGGGCAMAQPDTTETTSEVHSYRARVAEHGRFRAVMESFAYLPPFGWLTSPVGKAMKGSHYWAAQAFFFFLVLHLIRVWATGAFRGRRWLSWALGSAVLLLGLGENLFGLLARGDWESQFVAMHSDDMLFVQPYFFSLFSPANFTADLAIHVAVIPVILFGLIMAHLTLVRLQGIARPL